MECIDQVAMLECFGGSLCYFPQEGGFFHCCEYLNSKGQLYKGKISNMSPGSECNKLAQQTMQVADVSGQRWGGIPSWKNGTLSPFCLFFCVCQHMYTEQRLIIDAW